MLNRYCIIRCYSKYMSLEKIKSEAAGLDEEVLKTKSVMEEIM